MLVPLDPLLAFGWFDALSAGFVIFFSSFNVILLIPLLETTECTLQDPLGTTGDKMSLLNFLLNSKGLLDGDCQNSCRVYKPSNDPYLSEYRNA